MGVDENLGTLNRPPNGRVYTKDPKKVPLISETPC